MPALLVSHRLNIQAIQLSLRLGNHLTAGAGHARLANLVKGGKTPRFDRAETLRRLMQVHNMSTVVDHA